MVVERTTNIWVRGNSQKGLDGVVHCGKGGASLCNTLCHSVA